MEMTGHLKIGGESSRVALMMTMQGKTKEIAHQQRN